MTTAAPPAAAPTAAIDLNDPAIQAIVRDRVERETAALTTRATEAEASLSALQTKYDAAEAAKTAAETARDAVQAELAALQETHENEKAAAGRRDERLKVMREAASVTEEFLAERADRIAGMKDEEFEAYKAEIAAASPKVAGQPPAGGTQATPPRETAMAGTSATSTGAGEPKPSTKFLGNVGYSGVRRG